MDLLAAHAYGLRPEEFEHIVGTFPLIREEVRAASIETFRHAINDVC